MTLPYSVTCFICSRLDFGSEKIITTLCLWVKKLMMHKCKNVIKSWGNWGVIYEWWPLDQKLFQILAISKKCWINQPTSLQLQNLITLQPAACSIGLLICTLISENQGLEKSRSLSNLRKISDQISVCHLDFFSGLMV